MPLCGIRNFLISMHFLIDTSDWFSMLFDKIRILGLSLNQHIIFVLVVRHVDRPSLRALVGPVSRFTMPITLANYRLGIGLSSLFVAARVVVGVDVEALAVGCTSG